MSIFDHPFFRKAPAFAALQVVSEPKPEHVRACLMELARYVLAELDKKNEPPTPLGHD